MATTYHHTAGVPSGEDGDIVAWTDDADSFDKDELAANWATVDTALNRLDDERMPLGTVVMWWRRANADPDVPGGTSGAVWQPCDGRTISAPNHDFPGGGTLTLPDMRNLVPVGSAVPSDAGASTPALTYPGDGVDAANLAGPLHAGGIGGDLGSMAPVAPPDHYHRHNHIHRVGSVTGVETLHATETDNASGGLNDSEHASPVFVDSDASGTGNSLVKKAHAHQLAALYGSGPKVPENANMRVVDAPGQPASAASDASNSSRVGTSLQLMADGTNAETGVTNDSTDSVTETPGGGTAGDDLNMDVRPAGLGVMFVMKVRHAPS